VPHRPPIVRRALWWRLGAAALLGAVFWLDVALPAGIAVPVLYVVPTLLFVGAGSPWEPLVVAGAATMLSTIAALVAPAAGLTEIAFFNRILAAVTVWLTAGLVSFYRVLVDRWTAQAARDRSATEESLRRLEEIRSALDQAAIVAATDQRGVITYVNEKFCEISKYSREELLGQDHRIINSAYHSQEFIRDLLRTIAQGRVWRGELRNRAKDGSIYWVDTTIVPFLDESGKPRQYLAIRSDITQRKAAEAQLSEQAALLQLGQLAAVVAHEVRNPLAGLRGSLQVLGSRFPAEAREREIISTMIERIDGLNRKVQDILLYARPNPPKLQAVSLMPVIAETAANARAAVGPGCPTITISGGNSVVNADPEMLRAALLNLLLNACQAGGDRPVEIATTAHNGACRVSVLDRGDGVPPDLRDRVFEPFLTSKKGGTGLGLPIVKRLMALQGGAVALRDREGGGTVAELTVPLAG
jgi:PAS domain S-box-containing protein